MNLIIFILVIFSIIIICSSNIIEGLETISQLTAKRGGELTDKEYESGFYETGAPAAELDADTIDKIDFTKALNDFDVEYHDPAEEIAKRNINGLPPDIVWVFDPNVNKKVAIKRPAMQNSVTYYEPGTYKYSGANYTPTYTESVLLSNTNQYFVNAE
jgi:hypothetical protein